ncbi:MAG: YceI family protein [Arcobacteraceae bacterium]
MRKLLLILSLSLFAVANTLTFEKGEISAHTEIFGDSNINPSTKTISSTLQIDTTLESIKGKIMIDPLSLKSDKNGRDEHMYELLNTKTHPSIFFEITNIEKTKKYYKINGTLTLNGVSKNIVSFADIQEYRKDISIKGLFSINLTQFGMKPPSMFFVTVRDKIDINYKLSYKKEK